MRLIAALLLALVLTGCATSTKPGAIGVTRSQLLIVPSSTVDSLAAQNYSKLSTAAGNAGKLNSDDALTQRVRTISYRLIKRVDVFRPDASAWQWEINVFQSDQLNAFCMPGGKIGIYSGLITKLGLSDDELAAVIGHEIAHALREHSREKMSQAQLSNAFVQGILSSGSKNAGVAGAAVAVGSQLFIQLPYSRDMELEADSMGLELMARAGFDPRTASNVWRKMLATSPERSKGDFLSTHPNSDRRIAELDANVPKVLALYERTNELPGPLATAPTLTSVAKPDAAPAESRTAPLDNGSLPSTTLASEPVKGHSGQDSPQVERLAREAQCHASPRGELVDKGPGFERYAVACKNGSTLRYRCEFGICRAEQPAI